MTCPRDAGNKNTDSHWLRTLPTWVSSSKSGTLKHLFPGKRGGASRRSVRRKHARSAHSLHPLPRPAAASSPLAWAWGRGFATRPPGGSCQASRSGESRRAEPTEDPRPRNLVPPRLAPSEPRCRHSFAVSRASFPRGAGLRRGCEWPRHGVLTLSGHPGL